MKYKHYFCTYAHTWQPSDVPSVTCYKQEVFNKCDNIWENLTYGAIKCAKSIWNKCEICSHIVGIILTNFSYHGIGWQKINYIRICSLHYIDKKILKF